MLNIALLCCAISLYLIATLLIIKALRGSKKANDHETADKGSLESINNQSQAGTSTDLFSSQISRAFMVGGLGSLAHIFLAYHYSVQNGLLDFSLGSMAILISGLLCLIFVLGGLALPVRRLGIIVFPLTVISVLFGWFWAAEPSFRQGGSAASTAHIVVSILAYCLLAIASIQALLYTYQERQFKKRVTPAMLIALPPLQTMEQLLFRLIWSGFALLTFTLVSGAIFSNEIYNRPFEFKHHTILASLGWLVFAYLLLQRVTRGIRGSQAVYWTIAGFLLIQLGYFGTKFVTETLAVQ